MGKSQRGDNPKQAQSQQNERRKDRNGSNQFPQLHPEQVRHESAAKRTIKTIQRRNSILRNKLAESLATAKSRDDSLSHYQDEEWK